MKRKIFLVFLTILFTVSVFSQNANLQTAATVNLIRTESITVGQLRANVERLEKAGGRPLTEAERRQVLDAMINERLVLQAAERDRITATDNEINGHLQQLRAMLAQTMNRQPTDAEFTQAVMSEFGMDLTTFREELRKQMISEKFLMQKKGAQIEAAIRIPTEAEITAEYNLRRAQLVRPETVRFTLIEIPYGSDAAARNRARETANRLIREIGSDPAKFDEAVARSITPNSGYQAGDFGYLPRIPEARNAVGEALMNTAFSLRQGQVSSLIESPNAFHIIKVVENHAHKNLELDDIIQLGSSISVRNFLGQSMLNERQQTAVARASEELINEIRTPRSFQIFENNLNW